MTCVGTLYVDEARLRRLTKKPAEDYSICEGCKYNNGVREKDNMPCGSKLCLKSLDNLAAGGMS